MDTKTKIIISTLLVVSALFICGAIVVNSNSNNSDDKNGDSPNDNGGLQVKYQIEVTRTNGGSASGGGQYNSGSSVVLTAVPNEGYRFNGWYEGISLYSVDPNLRFQASKNISLRATFELGTYNVTVTSNNVNAGQATGGGSNIKHNDYVSLSCTTNMGYKFEGWYVNDALVSTAPNTSYRVQMNANVEARYSILHDASFSLYCTDSKTLVPVILNMNSTYNVEVFQRTWTITDTLTGRTIKFETGLNGNNRSTSLRIDVGCGLDVTQTIVYTDGQNASKTMNFVVDDKKTERFSWRYHEDHHGAWWNPFDKDDLDPTNMNRDASINVPMSFAWYYRYASDPITRGYDTSVLSRYVTPNDSVIQSLATSMKNATSGWSAVDRANYVLHFVQSIPYKYDNDSDATIEHWNYPAETLWRNQGDCEDHAFLYASLMKALGYKVVLFWVNASGSGHLAVGADVPNGTGTSFTHQGTKYFYCEATPGLSQSYWRNVGYMPTGYTVTGIYNT